MYKYTYDIRAFAWNSKTRTFSQDAWNLEWDYLDGSVAVFPNMKEPFLIKNYKTEEERLFTFLDTDHGDWLFECAEDNLLCRICVDPF